MSEYDNANCCLLIISSRGSEMKTIAISDELHAELTNLKLKYKFKTLEKLLKYMLYEFRKKKLFDIKIKI